MPITRVTFSSNHLLIRDNLFKVQRQYEEAAVPATTGRKINFLSDDPARISRLFALRSEVRINEQYQRNLTEAELRLDFTDSRLSQAHGVLERVRELTLSANDPTIDSSLRIELGSQLDDLKSELLAHANAKIEGKYIFAGTATATQPFTGTPVTFAGNSTSIVSQATSTLQIRMNVDGDEIFTGEVGTAVGSDLATNLRNNSGDSLAIAVGDVITIGGSVGGTAMSGQTLTITATTDLDDIATAIQTALRSVADGDLTETAAVQSSGAIRVTTDATNAVTNLALTITGKTNFNTAFTYATSIAGGGATGDSDTLKSSTGEDVFHVIDNLKTAILAGNTTDIATELDRLDTGIQQILNARAAVGIRLQQVNGIEQTLIEDGVRFMNDLSNIEDASIDVAFSNLVTRETALRLVFASSSRIMSTLSGLNLLS